MICPLPSSPPSVTGLAAIVTILLSVPVRGDDAADFRANVAPILIEHCLVCHGGDAVEGGYDLSTLASLGQPGDSAVAPIVAGDPTSSELMQRLVTDNASDLMPAGGPPLGEGQIDAIYQWIAAGAALPDADPNTRLIDVLEVTSDYPLPPTVYPRPIPVSAAAIAADGTIAIGGYRELLVWPPGQTTSPERIDGFGDSIAAVQISSSGNWLAVAHGTPGQRGEVTIARQTDQRLKDRQVVFRSSDVASGLAFSPGGEFLAIATLAGELAVVELPADPTTDGAAREAAAVVASGGSGTALPLRLNLTPHADAISAVAWSANGKDLLTASRDRTARVIRLQDGQSTSNYTMHERAVHGICQIKAGTVTLDETGTLRLWSAGGRTPRIERPRVSDAALGLYVQDETVLVPSSRMVRRLIVEQVEQDDGTDENGQPKKRRVPRWKELPSLDVGASDLIVSLAVSPTGAVIVGTQAGQIYRWEAGAAGASSQPPLIAAP